MKRRYCHFYKIIYELAVVRNPQIQTHTLYIILCHFVTPPSPRIYCKPLSRLKMLYSDLYLIRIEIYFLDTYLVKFILISSIFPRRSKIVVLPKQIQNLLQQQQNTNYSNNEEHIKTKTIV